MFACTRDLMDLTPPLVTAAAPRLFVPSPGSASYARRLAASPSVSYATARARNFAAAFAAPSPPRRSTYRGATSPPLYGTPSESPRPRPRPRRARDTARPRLSPSPSPFPSPETTRVRVFVRARRARASARRAASASSSGAAARAARRSANGPSRPPRVSQRRPRGVSSRPRPTDVWRCTRRGQLDAARVRDAEARSPNAPSAIDLQRRPRAAAEERRAREARVRIGAGVPTRARGSRANAPRHLPAPGRPLGPFVAATSPRAPRDGLEVRHLQHRVDRAHRGFGAGLPPRLGRGGVNSRWRSNRAPNAIILRARDPARRAGPGRAPGRGVAGARDGVQTEGLHRGVDVVQAPERLRGQVRALVFVRHPRHTFRARSMRPHKMAASAAATAPPSPGRGGEDGAAVQRRVRRVLEATAGRAVRGAALERRGARRERRGASPVRFR